MARRNIPKAERYENRGHHIQFYASQHEAMPATRAIRRMPGLIVAGWREPHEFLHKAVAYVPPLSMHMAQQVLKHYVDYPNNHLRSMDSLMHSIEQAQQHPRANELEIAIGDLAIQAVDLQRPYIREMQRDVHTFSTDLSTVPLQSR